MVFAKWPEPGKVKTRIAKVLGDEEAAAIYRVLVRRVMENLAAFSRGAGDLWLVVDPATREAELRGWLDGEMAAAGWSPERVEYRPQADGDLGDRLRGAFEAAFRAGYRQVAAIGTDCVDLETDLVTRAFASAADVVFGPAGDGGYYLVRLRDPAGCAVFDGVPWSTGQTLQQSLAAAGRAGLGVELLAELDDIDTAEDWRRAGRRT